MAIFTSRILKNPTMFRRTRALAIGGNSRFAKVANLTGKEILSKAIKTEYPLLGIATEWVGCGIGVAGIVNGDLELIVRAMQVAIGGLAILLPEAYIRNRGLKEILSKAIKTEYPVFSIAAAWLGSGIGLAAVVSGDVTSFGISALSVGAAGCVIMLPEIVVRYIRSKSLSDL